MSNNKNTSGRTYGKGYYIALILCAAAIGITGYLYYRNANADDAKLQNNDKDVAVWGSDSQKPGKDVTKPSVPEATKPMEPTTPAEKTTIKTTAPVTGKTISEYAMDCLSYNQTTRDWRTHNGIDIAAEAGTKVGAAADGVVYTVFEDDSLGTTVVIRHEGGYTTNYSSLAEKPAVSAGDTVKMGQAIGCVGETALIENTLGPHVHFSVSYRDEVMDPMEFLKMN